MAVYKVYLTVKDSYGKEKEIEAGNINVDLELGDKEFSQIEEALPLDEYLKKAEIDTELAYYATDAEVESAVENTVKYGEFEIKGKVGN